MMKWITSLVLIAALAGSVLAGTPMHSDEHSCGMSGMMDCCETALAQDGTSLALVARLCCVMNCSQPGTTTSSAETSRIPSSAAFISYPTIPQSPLTVQSISSLRRAQGFEQGTSPPYIRHLALLI